MTSWAEATPSQAEIPDWQWQEDSYSWKYVSREGEFKKNRWEKINGYWYYFDSDGYITTEWTEIRGINYCFRETGELELGWIYDEEEEKWYLNMKEEDTRVELQYKLIKLNNKKF